MATIVDRFELAWEGFYPGILALACGAGALAFAPAAFRAMAASGWQVGSIYSSVFDLSAIFTALLFAFYTFALTTDRGFIGRAKGSRYYAMMVRYTLRALVLGGMLTLVSIPMMVVEPKPMRASGIAFYAVAAWVTLSVWAIAAFARAARIFSIFAGRHA